MKDVKGDDFQPFASLLSQSWFNVPIIRLSEEQTKAGGKAYTYYFTPESPDPVMKCGHAIELSVVFNHPEMSADTGRTFDETFCKTVRKMWIQFAKTGNPSLTADQSPDGKAKEWPLYDRKDKQVMVLDEFDIHPAKEADVKVVDWDRTYFLTKYYAL
jgi:para-nitrobenzyl esterase